MTRNALLLTLIFSISVTVFLLVKSLTDFSMTGPNIQKEVIDNFSGYIMFSMARLGAWTFLITFYLFGLGVVLYACLLQALKLPYKWYFAFLSGITSFGAICFLQFLKNLYFIPSNIVSSFLYRTSRLYPILDTLSAQKLEYSQAFITYLSIAIILFYTTKVYRQKDRQIVNKLNIAIVLFSIPLLFTVNINNPITHYSDNSDNRTAKLPNIIMIGADTLRADRLGAAGYFRNLTPNIDSLAREGVQFTNFFVPIARTAPSLTTYLTGTWPHTHGIRDNYNTEEMAKLKVKTLPAILANYGYTSEVITDWAGGDLGKISFGFDRYDGPEDQWNIKYLMRQGPKDIRLFLSLFTYNIFGKTLLPELYYLAGTPLTKELEKYSKQRITELSRSGKPFFLTIFTSTTHIPFGCEYPYYSMFADPDYRGESRFAMAGLTTPDEVIKKQGESKKNFDVQQIVDLYDGCVKNFDDSVGQITAHIKSLGLDKDTIIIIFSDHGVDLFEKQTWGQGNSVLGDDPSARVPLVMLHPSLPKNKRITKVTRSVDLAPTLLDMLNIPAESSSMEGVSLTSCINSDCPDLALEAFFETGVWLTPLATLNDQHLRYPSAMEFLEVPNRATGTLGIKKEFRDIDIEARDRMIRSDKWKLVYLPMQKGAIYWLFDNETDPTGEIDISKQKSEVFADMKYRLVSWMSLDPERKWENEHIVRKH